MSKLSWCLLSIILLLITYLNVFAESTGKLSKLMVFQNEISYGSVNSSDNSLLITFYNDNNLYWYKGNKVIKTIKNAEKGTFSPDGSCYSYLSNNFLYIVGITKKNLISKLAIKDNKFESVVWSYDSNLIYWCEHLEKEYKVYSFNVNTKEKRELLKSSRFYFHPVTTKDSNILFLLNNKDPETVGFDCDIIKYNIKDKKIEPIRLPPIEKLWINSNFTVSPDGGKIIFVDNESGKMYIIDIIQTKIIDEFKTLAGSDPMFYSWKSDGSFIIFNQTPKDLYKYIIPNE